MISTNSNQSTYIKVASSTVLSLAFDKILFSIPAEDVVKFPDQMVKTKLRDDGTTKYAVCAKIPPPSICELYKVKQKNELSVGTSYQIVFKEYAWRMNGNTGTALQAYIGGKIERPMLSFDEELERLLDFSEDTIVV